MTIEEEKIVDVDILPDPVNQLITYQIDYGRNNHDDKIWKGTYIWET